MPSAPPPSGPPPAVSVVTPAWNRRGSLRMSVDSVLRQAFADFELIVVDDGSTDGTMEAIADITDPRLRRLAHEVNKGVSAARNTGIRAAQGEWVAFHDSDDEWLPLKLEKQMAQLNSAGAEVVACHAGILELNPHGLSAGRAVIIYAPSLERRVVKGDLERELLQRHLVDPKTLIARRLSLLQFGGFDEALALCEDWECSIQLAKLGEFAFVDEPLVVRRPSTNSLTSDWNRHARPRLRVLEKHRKAMATVPAAAAHHYVVTAGEFRRTGDVSSARASLVEAARLRPFSLPIRLRQLRLLLPQWSRRSKRR